MKLRTTKKIVSCILSVLLLASTFLVSANANEISDAVTDENTKSYLVNEEKTFDGNKANGLDITEDLDFFTGNSSGTWTMSFKTTSSEFLSPVGFASAASGTQNQYIAVYLTGGNTIGIQIRKDGDDTQKKFTKSYSDGKYHTLTFTVKENEYYKFYFDGECVLSETASSTKWFSNLGVTFGKAGIGGITRSDGSGWGFNGTIKDVYLSNFALDETEILKFHGVYPESIVSQTGLKDTTGTEVMNITDEFDFDTIKTMRQGSMNITYKKDADVGNSLYTLIACSDADQNENYANFYVNKAGTKVGFELKYGTKSYQMAWDGVSLNDNNWHNVGFVYSGNGITLYVDGKAYGEKTINITLQDFALWAAGIDTVTVGGMVRGSYNTADKLWYSDFNISNITLYSNILSATQMALVQNGTGGTAVSEEQVSDRTGLFYSGYGNSANYRIPAMVTAADGTLVASIDQRKTTAADYGDIDLMVRRSEDKGETWSDPIMLTDLPSGGSNHSFIIDSELLVSKETGTIYCLVDMFPESLALMGGLETGSGYTEVDGTKYLTLYDAEKNIYTMREDNIVYDAEGNVTNYKVTDFSTGKLVKTVEGEEVDAGSIFLYTGANKGELSVLKTSYLWLFKSTDNGLTWSDPVDITGMVKEDWMVFCGTGPGSGISITTDEGTERLLFSIYFTNSVTVDSQSSASIYSDDGGVTWHRGQSPQEILDNGNRDPGTEGYTGATNIQEFNGSSKLNDSTDEKAPKKGMLTENVMVSLGGENVALLSRNNKANYAYVSLSSDGGETWDSCKINQAIPEYYCQLSAIVHEYKGRKYLVISNPNASGRYNMTIRVTGITDGTISTNSSDWKYTTINAGHDQYSCLTSIDENTIGILYETDTNWHALDMLFQKFSFEYLLQGNGGNVNNIPKYPEITDISAEVINGANGSEGVTEVGDTIKVKVTLGVPVFVTGNAQVKLQYNVGDEIKTVYADYAGGSGTNEIYFDYVIEEAFRGEISAVLAPIANLESSTGRAVSSLRDGEAIAVANYGTDLDIVSATAGSEETAQAASGASKAIDGNPSTMWHSKWGAGNNRDDLWITLDLGEVKGVSGLRYLPRQSQTNGIITEYDILVSTDGTEFTSVAKGTWAGDSKLKTVEFDYAVEAKYVKLVAVDSMSTEAANTYASAAEIQLFYYPEETEPDFRAELTAALADAEAKLQEVKEDTNTIWYQPDVTALENKIGEAKTLLENAEATDESLSAMTEELKAAMIVRLMSGDVNGDGKISVNDATLIQLYTINAVTEEYVDVTAADTDGNSLIDINDATDIQKYLVELIDTLAPINYID